MIRQRNQPREIFSTKLDRLFVACRFGRLRWTEPQSSLLLRAAIGDAGQCLRRGDAGLRPRLVVDRSAPPAMMAAERLLFFDAGNHFVTRLKLPAQDLRVPVVYETDLDLDRSQ